MDDEPLPDEELPEEAIRDLRKFVDSVKQHVSDEHSFIDKIYSWDYIVEHAEAQVVEGSRDSIAITNLYSVLLELRDYATRVESTDVAIDREEEHILGKLHRDVEHRNWHAVRKDFSEGEEIEKQAYRLEEDELKYYEEGFLKILRIIKEHGPFPAEIERHMGELANFARNYERIFRHLWRKERALKR
ncbi:MAG: hypothetical protein ABIJ21_05335 [Nanoarchaeota archaeon]